MALYNKFRPQNFDDFFGNKAVVSALKKIVKSKPKDRPHTFLFQGMSGCGKTTLARILTKEFGCNGVFGLEELNAANTRGIEMVREVVDKAVLKPLSGKCRVFIWDESHQLTTAAQQALLKVIEDVPEFTYFIFCTTDPQRIIKTILNRCTIFQLELLKDGDLAELIECVLESLDENISDNVFDKLIFSADGSPRKSLVMLEQILIVKNEEEQLALLQKATAETEVKDLCRALLKRAKWREVSGIFQGINNIEPEMIRRAIIGYMKTVLLKANKVEAYIVLDCLKNNLYDSGEPGLVLELYESVRYIQEGGK